MLRVMSVAAAATALTLGVMPPAGASATRATLTPPPVVGTADLGPIVQNPHVLFRDGLFSGEFNGSSIWTFGDTGLNAPNSQGADWDDNSAASTTDLDGSRGLSLPNDAPETAAGVPDQYLPFTAAEIAFNAAHAGSGSSCQEKPCGEEYALWNGPVVPDPARNRVLFFYYELERITGQPSWTSIGEGIATWQPGQPVVRPIESPGSTFPTLMFGPKGPDFGEGAVVVGTTMYAYGCTAGFLVQNCDIGRVPLADATNRSDWTFYTAAGTWSPHLSEATTVIQGGAAGTSVSWVPYLGEYMAVYMPPEADEVVDRVAPEPWGPWSAASNVVATAPPAAGDVDYAGMAHPEFAQDDGRVQYVAYYHPLGAFSGEDRWLQITFGDPGSA
jgi:hypothetical protein